MGSSLNTMIGPYIKVSGEKTKVVVKVKRVCPNSHKIKGYEKYCSQCGSEIKSVEYNETEEVIPSDVVSEHELLYSMAYSDDILLSFSSPPNKISVDDDCVIDFCNIQKIKEEQIKWFVEKHKEDILLLNEAFGSDNVDVKFGLIQYWS